MCCTRLAENTGRKKVAKNRHLCTIAPICSAISSQLRHLSTIGKNFLNSNTSSTCPHNMMNFGLLAAEIRWRVWGTFTNFNGFLVLAALLHGIWRQPNFAALNRGCHLCPPGRPSRWALAHISSVNLECRSETCCARLAENTARKNRQKFAIWAHPTNLSGYIFSTKACIDNRKKTC